MTTSRWKGGKVYKDIIHGEILVSPLAQQIIDTSEFQKLAKLKQLALVHYVYGSANHNRKEHSIGVYFLTGKYLEHLGRHTSIDERTKELIKIAGLVHDIGHALFSHMFDRHFSEQFGIPHHEVRGTQIFRSMVTKYKLELREDEVNLICDIIRGGPDGSFTNPCPPMDAGDKKEEKKEERKDEKVVEKKIEEKTKDEKDKFIGLQNFDITKMCDSSIALIGKRRCGKSGYVRNLLSKTLDEKEKEEEKQEEEKQEEKKVILPKRRQGMSTLVRDILYDEKMKSIDVRKLPAETKPKRRPRTIHIDDRPDFFSKIKPSLFPQHLLLNKLAAPAEITSTSTSAPIISVIPTTVSDVSSSAAPDISSSSSSAALATSSTTISLQPLGGVGARETGQRPHPRWVYQIVNNQAFELDTDKMDYLLRDAECTGIPSAIQIDRIFNHCRIDQMTGDIIFDKKIYLQIYDVFMARYRMHKEVYCHKTVIAISILVVRYLKLLFSIPSIAEGWPTYTDDILEYADQQLAKRLTSFEYTVQDIEILKQCSKLKKNIDTRNIPKLIFEKSETTSSSSGEQLSNEDLVDEAEKEEEEKNLTDVVEEWKNQGYEIIKENFSLGFCSNKKMNPMSRILFYQSNNNYSGNSDGDKNAKIKQIKPHKISKLLTNDAHENITFFYKWSAFEKAEPK